MATPEQVAQGEGENAERLEKTGNCLGKCCTALPLGTWFGIRVRISVFYFLFWGAMGYFGRFFNYMEDAVLWIVMMGPLLALTILVHELGHGIITKKLGGTATDILLWPLGGLCLLDHDKGPMVDFWITIAGPLTHIPQGIFWLVQAPFAKMVGDCPWTDIWPDKCIGTYWEVFWYRVVFFGVGVNVLMFAFNLFLPAYPLDGGRALLDVFLVKGLTPRKAAIGSVCISVSVSITAAVLLVVYLGDWLGFAVFLLLLVPNAAMVYLIIKNELHVHPLFRNLKIGRDDLDTPLVAEDNLESSGQAQELDRL